MHTCPVHDSKYALADYSAFSAKWKPGNQSTLQNTRNTLITQFKTFKIKALVHNHWHRNCASNTFRLADLP